MAPRRDPRLLLLEGHRGFVAYAALDPWEIRGLGEIETHALADSALAVVQLLLRVRPSQVACIALPRPLRVAVEELAQTRGLALVRLGRRDRAALLLRAPSVASARARFPELRHLALVRLRSTLRLALAFFMTRSLTLPRRYVSKLPPHTPPRVDR